MLPDEMKLRQRLRGKLLKANNLHLKVNASHLHVNATDFIMEKVRVAFREVSCWIRKRRLGRETHAVHSRTTIMYWI